MATWEVVADPAAGEAGKKPQGPNFHSHYINLQTPEGLSELLFRLKARLLFCVLLTGCISDQKQTLTSLYPFPINSHQVNQICSHSQ